jgi:hypothetical protein
MGFKPSEIILIAFAVLIPVVLFVALLIPGGISTLFGFMVDPTLRPIVFGGGAFIVFGVLCYRIYSRVSPRKKPKTASTYDPEAAAHARETWNKPKQ